MKTKIKTARERSNEFCDSLQMQVIPWDIRRSFERTLAREFDNHARRAHERHRRRNYCVPKKPTSIEQALWAGFKP